MMKLYLSFVIFLVLHSNLSTVEAAISLVKPLSGLNVCEDEPVDTVIFTLEATGGTAPYEYSIISSEFLTYVSVGPVSGEIKIIRQFNRDIQTQAAILVEVVISDSSPVPQTYSDKSVAVVINDANDNTPILENLPYTANIYESPWSNETLVAVTASDVDDLGQVMLLVKDPAAPVFFDGNILKLNQTAVLDYETSPVLTVEIVAQDSGGGCQASKEPRSKSTTVLINIMDGPDNGPLFQSTFVQLKENSRLGTELTIVTARDQDYVLNWNMRYTIVPDGVAENWFEVDSSTGRITVIGDIDREADAIASNQGNFEFKVTAKEVIPTDSPFNDGTDCYAPCQSNATVTVTVLDVNDNAPAFYYLDPNDATSKTSQSRFNASIEENTANLISVPDLHIYVEDADESKNAQFSLEIVGPEADVFEVVPTQVLSGEASVVIRVKNSTALDYEKVQEFNLELLAQELSTAERKTATATVTIQLTDANDHTPEFSFSLYDPAVMEGSPSGTVIIIVTATDDDVLDVNRNVNYALMPDSILTSFAIDPHSGTVTLVGSLDREFRSLYYVTVTATDGGGRSSSTNLEITVLDANDETPKFMRSSYSATVKENAASFTTPLEIVASDDDQTNTSNSEIVYSVVGGDISDQFFVETGTSSGEIKLKSPIDLESLDPSLLVCSGGAIDITLIVMAEDRGVPSLSVNTTVAITIEDENDNTPEFNSTGYAASVPEKSDSGTEVLQVFAFDDDACKPNSDITYQLSSNNVEAINAFTIGSQDGVLKVRSPDLDRDVISNYDIEVLAIDSGGVRATGTTIVNVTITDVNDKLPAFTATNFSPNVSELVAVDDVIWTATASDSDDNANLEYSLSNLQCYNDRGIALVGGCGNPFQMTTNSQVGELVVKSKLDRETIARYTADVSVEDLNADGSAQRTTESFQLIVDDANDNRPQFANITEAFEVNEEVQNSVIGQVTATDPDAGANGAVTYSVSIEDAQWVTIDAGTGLLTTTNQIIDRETFGDWLNITVIAMDGGSPPLNQAMELRIKIVDINDNDPVFVETPYLGKVLENATTGEVVLTVRATDEDTGVGADIVYDVILGDNLGQFGINRTSGELFVAGELNRESLPGYSLTVAATDNKGVGGNRQTTSVEIEILDVNDSPPSFSSSIYQTSFNEDSQNGSEVYTLTATDKDDGVNARIRYSIVAGNKKDHFQVDPVTGVVTLKSSIRNDEAEYELEIMAMDGGENPMNDTCLLRIAVIDANLNTPQFNNLPTNQLIAVEENSIVIPTVVFQVNATDRDRGDNGLITYTLTAGESNFFIDSTDGTISARTVFNRETKDSYEVTIKASDNDPIAPRFEEETITVHILDVDDNDPMYNTTDNEQIMSLTEEEQPGPLPVRINEASDADSAENSINYYFITGGDGIGKFELNSATRILSTVEPLDRELQPQYDLVVTASRDPEFLSSNPDLSDDWENVQNDHSKLHVIITLSDINDNPPVFSKAIYDADIPFDSQPNIEAIIVQVYASDADSGDNAIVSYSILETYWVLGGSRTPLAPGPFNVVLSRDGVSGDIYLEGAINDNENGQYEVTVKATDSDETHTSETLVKIGIIKKDETVVLYSRLTTAEFKSVEDTFVADLGALLGAKVYVDSVLPHEKKDETDLANSDITIHAKELNSTALVPKQEISSQLSKTESNDFLAAYLITGVGSVSEPPVSRTQDYLVAGLIVAIVLIVLVSLAFIIAIVCIRRKLLRKLGVAKASEAAMREMNNLKSNEAKSKMPNTNLYADENPIYIQNQNQAIDLDGWLRNQESKDDDDDDVIDDNALNSQDSAIGISDPNTLDGDDEQGWGDGQFDIDFDEGDNARLAAALNAANQRRGADNLTFLFDDDANAGLTSL